MKNTYLFFLLLLITNMITGYATYEAASGKKIGKNEMESWIASENAWLEKERQYTQVQAHRDSAFAVKDSLQRELVVDLYKNLVIAKYGKDSEKYFESNMLHSVDSLLKIRFPGSRFRVSYTGGQIDVDMKDSAYTAFEVNSYLSKIEKGVVYLDAKRMVGK